jgi:hypothetical protein
LAGEFAVLDILKQFMEPLPELMFEFSLISFSSGGFVEDWFWVSLSMAGYDQRAGRRQGVVCFSNRSISTSVGLHWRHGCS